MHIHESTHAHTRLVLMVAVIAKLCHVHG
jgi:hypothetical protein